MSIKVMRKIETVAVMSVFECHDHICGHRIIGDINPQKADILPVGLGEGGFSSWFKGGVVQEMLYCLQEAGVKPGTRLKITIEEVPE